MDDILGNSDATSDTSQAGSRHTSRSNSRDSSSWTKSSAISAMSIDNLLGLTRCSETFPSTSELLDPSSTSTSFRTQRAEPQDGSSHSLRRGGASVLGSSALAKSHAEHNFPVLAAAGVEPKQVGPSGM